MATPARPDHFDQEQDLPDSSSEEVPSAGNEDAAGPNIQLLQDFFDSLPEEMRQNIPPPIQELLRAGRGELRAVSARLSMTQGGPFNPVAAQITGQHITGVIDLQGRELENEDRQSDRDFQANREEGRIFAGLAVLGVVAVLGICALAAWQVPAYLPQIVTGSIGTAAGLIGGYGIGRSRGR